MMNESENVKVTTRKLFDLGLLRKCIEVLKTNVVMPFHVEISDMATITLTKEQAAEIGVPLDAMVTK